MWHNPALVAEQVATLARPNLSPLLDQSEDLRIGKAVRSFNRSPDTATLDEVRRFQLHLIAVIGVSLAFICLGFWIGV